MQGHSTYVVGLAEDKRRKTKRKCERSQTEGRVSGADPPLCLDSHLLGQRNNRSPE